MPYSHSIYSDQIRMVYVNRSTVCRPFNIYAVVLQRHKRPQTFNFKYEMFRSKLHIGTQFTCDGFVLRVSCDFLNLVGTKNLITLTEQIFYDVERDDNAWKNLTTWNAYFMVLHYSFNAE